MSGGLWFVVCIPTEQCERERFEPLSRTLLNNSAPSALPPQVPKNGSGLPTLTDSTEAHKESTDVKAIYEEPLEQVLRKTLEELRIHDALWILDSSEKYFKVSFPCHPGLRCDLVLTSLTTNGIGLCKGSSLGILPCTVLLQDEDFGFGNSREHLETVALLSEDKKSESNSSTLSKTKLDIKKAFRGFKDMQKKFLKTVTARLTVAQVVEGVRAGATPTFDFIMFVLVASMIAALGLLENSSVVIVASMLISPIMGPILAGTFGAVIRDSKLRNLGIKTEILGLFLCVIFGFVFGLLGGFLNDLWGHQLWPTPEMISRGQDRSLWIGALIALPSGAGVALSVLGGNAGCLVGVAISASLLPPAVNAGLLWGLAAIRTMKAQDEQFQFVQVGGLTRVMKPSLAPFKGYEPTYFEDMDRECALLGLVSLALALINIVCIFIAAVLVLKIKEVAPRTSLSKTTRFWKEDIRIARNYNKSMPPTEAEELGNQFLAEWASLNGLEPADVLSDDEEATITRMETLKDLIQDVEADEVFRTVMARSAGVDARPPSQRLSVMTSLHPNAPGTSRDVERASRIKSWFNTPHREPTSQTTSLDGETDPDLRDVELRRHPPGRGTATSKGTRDSVALLRKSLAHADNPYTLWPSHRRPSHDRAMSRLRLSLLPATREEEEESSTPTYTVSPPRVVSRFLQPPRVVVRETTC